MKNNRVYAAANSVCHISLHCTTGSTRYNAGAKTLALCVPFPIRHGHTCQACSQGKLADGTFDPI